MAKRSNLVVVLGLAVFMVGAGATFLIARDNGDEAPKGPTASVLYAAKAIPSGTSGGNAVNQGFVRSKNIAASAKPENALTDSSQIVGRVAVRGVAEGQVLTADQFQEAQTRIGTLKIPEGKNALALKLDNVPGVAGFAGAGDHINVFGLIEEGQSGPQAKLIMQNVEVLNVNGASLAGGQGQPGGGGLVFLLAVDPTAAEQLVYLTSFQQLYFSLVAKDQAPVGGTPGVNQQQALKTL